MAQNQKKIKRRILFVCLGNICRSPTAEAVFRKKIIDKGWGAYYHIDSAGTSANHCGESSDARSIRYAIKRGYAMEHKARQFIVDDFSKFDRILCMDDTNYLNVTKLLYTEKDLIKVEKMASYLRKFNDSYILDPWSLDSAAFEHVLDLLEDACDNLLIDEQKYI